jgi:hypothetical protein
VTSRFLLIEELPSFPYLFDIAIHKQNGIIHPIRLSEGRLFYAADSGAFRYLNFPLGFLSMMHEARTDLAMWFSLLFLLIAGAGRRSLDAKIAGDTPA